GKTSIFSHPVYLFLREFSLQDFRGGSMCALSLLYYYGLSTVPFSQNIHNEVENTGKQESYHFALIRRF
ncbi:hypothetical protein, partial [Escherichia coli]